MHVKSDWCAAGTRRGDVRAVAVGTAFAAMSALLLIHALGTPEIVLEEDETGLLAFAGGATLPVGAAILCLAAHPRLRGQAGLGILRRLQAATVGWILALGVPVALDLRRDAPSHPLTGDLAAAQLVAAEEALLGPQVRALMVRLAEKDASTEEHTRRVALLAVQLGEHLGGARGAPACARDRRAPARHRQAARARRRAGQARAPRRRRVRGDPLPSGTGRRARRALARCRPPTRWRSSTPSAGPRSTRPASTRCELVGGAELAAA